MRKKRPVLNAKASSSRLKAYDQPRKKLSPSAPAACALIAGRAALATSSAAVMKTIDRSVSLATGHGRISSESNTSFSAMRSPPKKRDENHRNNGTPNTVSRPRACTSAVRAPSARRNISGLSLPPTGSSRPSSSWTSI